MSQYIIKYTDPLKTSFNVQPYTTNGRTNPTLAPLDPNAVTSSSSLLIYGKGMPEYGQNVQNNMLHLLENFASPASDPPLDQTEGQLWYNNTALELKIWEPAGPTPTLWSSVLLDTGTAPMRADFDLNNNRILNVPTAPTAVTDAVNEQYVLNHAADADLHITSEQNLLLDEIELIYAASLELKDLAGKIIALETFDITAGRTVEIALALKADKYVPATINNLAILDASGNLLDSGAQLSDFAPSGPHTHDATEVNFAGPYGALSNATVQVVIQELEDQKAPLESPTFTGTVQLDPGARLFLDTNPLVPLEAATRDFVETSVAAIVFAETGITRKVVTSTAATSYFSPPYTIGNNSLQVSVNGQKYYANSRGVQEVYINESGSTGLTNDATVYTFNIDIDGIGNQLISMEGQNAQTIADVISQIVNATITTAITGVTTTGGAGVNFFDISGPDLTSTFDPGFIFTVAGSTGNDGTYIVVSSSFGGGTTSIVVEEVIPSAIIDGSISYSFASDQITVTAPGMGLLIFESNNNTGVGTSSIAITDVDLFSSMITEDFAITNADTVLDEFTIETNRINRFQVGYTFAVTGSTGNDGAYTVTSSVYNSATDDMTIGVAVVTNATGDGVAEVSSTVEPAIVGAAQGYREEGAVDSQSLVVVFNAPVPTAGQIIEFIATN